MTVSVISFWIPLVWALIITIYWRKSFIEPINHWLVCALVFLVNFFWFAYMAIIFIVIAIFKSGILNKKTKEDEPGK